MKESRVKDGNYITIQSWMVKNLELKGNELIVYAIIYGFSQSEAQKFSGSLQYLADWTNSTKQGVTKSLKSLSEKGFIKKSEREINGVKFCDYEAIASIMVCNKVDGGMQQSLMGGMQQSLMGGMQQSLTNNIDLYKQENKQDIHYNPQDDFMNSMKTETPIQQEKQSQTDIKQPKEENLGFEDWYSHYPKKLDKTSAKEAWNKLKPDQKLIKHMIAAVETLIEKGIWSRDKSTESYKYIPYPAKWINKKRWEDEEAQPLKKHGYEVSTVDGDNDTFEDRILRSKVKVKEVIVP